MSHFIDNDELISTITDPSEDMEDRQYALFKLTMREEGESEEIHSEDVENFCANLEQA